MEHVVETVEINHLQDIIKQQKDEIFRLRKIIDALPSSIYWKDAEGVYLGRNSYSAAKMNSIHLEDDATPEAVIGQTDYDLFPVDIADEYRKNDLEVIENDIESIKEEVLTLPTGEVLIQLSSKKPLYDRNGLIVGVIGSTLDITEWKHAEERANVATQQALIAESKAEAEESLRKAVMMLSGSIVHDLKNSITALSWLGTSCQQELPKIIAGYNKAVEKKLVASDIPSYALEQISDMGNRVARMVTHFKEFMNTSLKTLRAAANKRLQSDDLMPCKVSHCLQTFETGFFCTPEEKKLITIRQDPDFEFMGNEILFVRILINLVTNALEQIKKNQTGKILISTEEGKSVNIIKVKDTAGGMSAEVRAHLFDGFNTTKADGNGIGLAFCKFVMQSFGGDITCDSVAGDYSEFVLTFPKQNTKK